MSPYVFAIGRRHCGRRSGKSAEFAHHLIQRPIYLTIAHAAVSISCYYAVVRSARNAAHCCRRSSGICVRVGLSAAAHDREPYKKWLNRSRCSLGYGARRINVGYSTAVHIGVNVQMHWMQLFVQSACTSTTRRFTAARHWRYS